MERTESVVVQVAPDYENEKIQEMQDFGWNLQGRQEIREEGEAYGRPSFLDSSTYVIKTKVSHYVKLHFVRPTGLPNLDRIKELENEYFSLPFAKPPGLKLPGCFTIFGILGILISFAMMGQEGAPGSFGVIMYLVWSALGVIWIRSRQRKRQEAEARNESSLARMAEIRAEVESLVSGS